MRIVVFLLIFCVALCLPRDGISTKLSPNRINQNLIIDRSGLAFDAEALALPEGAQSRAMPSGGAHARVSRLLIELVNSRTEANLSWLGAPRDQFGIARRSTEGYIGFAMDTVMHALQSKNAAQDLKLQEIMSNVLRTAGHRFIEVFTGTQAEDDFARRLVYAFQQAEEGQWQAENMRRILMNLIPELNHYLLIPSRLALVQPMGVLKVFYSFSWELPTDISNHGSARFIDFIVANVKGTTSSGFSTLGQLVVLDDRIGKDAREEYKFWGTLLNKKKRAIVIKDLPDEERTTLNAVPFDVQVGTYEDFFQSVFRTHWIEEWGHAIDALYGLHAQPVDVTLRRWVKPRSHLARFLRQQPREMQIAALAEILTLIRRVKYAREASGWMSTVGAIQLQEDDAKDPHSPAGLFMKEEMHGKLRTGDNDSTMFPALMSKGMAQPHEMRLIGNQIIDDNLLFFPRSFDVLPKEAANGDLIEPTHPMYRATLSWFLSRKKISSGKPIYQPRTPLEKSA